MIKEAIVKIVDKQDLTYEEAYQVMNEIMSGETTQTQNAAFLAALSTKSARAETIDEISGCAAAMRAHALKVEPGCDVLEIVGTAGVNIEYVYAFTFHKSSRAVLVFRFDDPDKATDALKAAGNNVLGDIDLFE